LPAKFSSVNAGIDCKKVGTDPVNLLYERAKTCSEVKVPRLLGIDPLNKLPVRINCVSEVGKFGNVVPASFARLFVPRLKNVRPDMLEMDV